MDLVTVHQKRQDGETPPHPVTMPANIWLFPNKQRRRSACVLMGSSWAVVSRDLDMSA